MPSYALLLEPMPDNPSLELLTSFMELSSPPRLGELVQIEVDWGRGPYIGRGEVTQVLWHHQGAGPQHEARVTVRFIGPDRE